MLQASELFHVVSTRFLVGVDAGRQQDHSAVCVLEVFPEMDYETYEDPQTLEMKVRPLTGYIARRLEQVELRTSYGTVITLVRLLAREAMGKGHTDIVVDALGPGRPLIDALSDAGLRVNALSAHGGQESTVNGLETSASKEQMVLFLTRLLGLRLLKIPKSLRYASALKEEFRRYQAITSTTGHTRYQAGGGAHDDLLSAIYVATFWDETMRRQRKRAHVWGRSAPHG